MSSDQASLSSPPQKLGRRAQKVQDRKDHILVTSARLFRERGYHAVSMDEIGAASGMSGPAMYKYFKDKAAILIAIVEYGTKIAKERSDEHTSELQSLMRISYAVFCL